MYDINLSSFTSFSFWRVRARANCRSARLNAMSHMGRHTILAQVMCRRMVHTSTIFLLFYIFIINNNDRLTFGGGWWKGDPERPPHTVHNVATCQMSLSGILNEIEIYAIRCRMLFYDYRIFYSGSFTTYVVGSILFNPLKRLTARAKSAVEMHTNCIHRLKHHQRAHLASSINIFASFNRDLILWRGNKKIRIRIYLSP